MTTNETTTTQTEQNENLGLFIDRCVNQENPSTRFVDPDAVISPGDVVRFRLVDLDSNTEIGLGLGEAPSTLNTTSMRKLVRHLIQLSPSDKRALLGLSDHDEITWRNSGREVARSSAATFRSLWNYESYAVSTRDDSDLHSLITDNPSTLND